MGGAGTTGTQTSSAAQTLAANGRVGKQAEIDALTDFSAQGGLTIVPRVSVTDGSVRAVADFGITGQPGQVVQIPAGFVAEDLAGNPLLDNTGQPITSFQLNSQGQAIVEVKTGGANLSSNQATVYPTAQAGTATGVGQNAVRAGMSGTLQSTPVIVIRR